MTVPSLEALRHFVEQTVLYLCTRDLDFRDYGVTEKPIFKGVATLDEYLRRASASMRKCILRYVKVGGVLESPAYMVTDAVYGAIPLVATMHDEVQLEIEESFASRSLFSFSSTLSTMDEFTIINNSELGDVTDVVLCEHQSAGAKKHDIILWFFRHGKDEVPTSEINTLQGHGKHMYYAMQRAASEIWRELDVERYNREKAAWDQDRPYNVLRRMFWGRFRSYWNPQRESGCVWEHHRLQHRSAYDVWKAQDLEDRRRGAEKRRIKEQEQIQRLGVDGFNRRMHRQKAESIVTKAEKIDRSSKEFLRFLDWRQSDAGKAYDKKPVYKKPEKVFPALTWTNYKTHTVPMATPRDLYDVLCRLVAEDIRVEVTLLSTAAIESVPVSYVVKESGKASRLENMGRGQDHQERRLTRHYEDADLGHLFGWIEGHEVWTLFPEEWRKYQGLERPLGNPQKSSRAESVRNLKGCIVKMKVGGRGNLLNFVTGATSQALSPDQVMDKFFPDPFSEAKRKAEEARREKAVRYQLRNRTPVVAQN